MLKFAQKQTVQPTASPEQEGSENTLRKKPNRPGLKERLKRMRERREAERKANKPLIKFSQDELDNIFKPELAQSLIQTKSEKDKLVDEKIRASFKNTKVPIPEVSYDYVTGEKKIEPEKDGKPITHESMLKEQMEKEKHKYDFKYIKRKFKSLKELDRDAYMNSEELYMAVRDPLI